MEFSTSYNKQPDDADTAQCCVCGRKIDLNYEDWHEHEDSGEYVCEYCWDDGKNKANDLHRGE